MRVSRLQLQGFKSFSGRAELELGPGITAIVGPNGSGKSNLVDAIRLVLGETSARELRGQRLDQVIFAGGAGKAPVGMAEVTLIFDNEDGRLPVEDVEVAISRRVFRDGTTEFRRNGQRVRLRDLGRLLDATGLAQAGYAVIAQNDIEAIIRATPAQRRHLIEEAAGVRGAQALIEDSHQRLRSLGDWLDGSTGRLAELLPRIESLREEAVAAEEASQLRARLQELRGSLERGAWLTALAELHRLERQLQAGERRLDQLRQRAREFGQTYAVERARLQTVEAGRLEAERQAGALALAAQQAAAQVELFEERATQAAEARAAATLALAEVREDLQGLPPGPGAGGEEAAEATAGRELVQGIERELAQLREERQRLREEQASAVGAEQEVERRVADARRRRSGLEARLAGAEAWMAQARAASVRAEEERAAAQARLQTEGASAGALRQEAGRQAAALERAERQELAKRQLLERADEGFSRATVALREADARLGAQVVAIEARTQAAPIAGAAARGGVKVRRLAEALQAAQAADAQAVEAGLGALQQALVGEEAQARRALGLAGGVAEVVCWPIPEEAEVANPPEGCRPLATTLVGDADALAVVARAARLVCLAQDRPAAARWLARFPDGRAVLADGTVLGTGLEVTPARDQGELRLVEQMRDAERAVQRQRAELARARESLERAREAHAQQRQEVDRLRSETAARQGQAGSRQAELDRLQAELSRATETIAGLSEELRRREADRAGDRSQLAELERELGAEEEALAFAAGGLAQARDLLAAADEAVAAGTQRLEEARLRIAGAEAEVRDRSRRTEELSRRRQQLVAREAGAQARIGAAEAGALEALQRLRSATAARGSAEAELRTAVERRAASQLGAEDPLRELGELEHRRAELEAQVETAAAQTQGWRQDVAAQAQEVERRRAEVRPGGAGGAEAEFGEVPQDATRAAAEIARAERRLSALGLINELAPRQLEEILGRTEGLRAAHEDCVAARGDLEALLGQLQLASTERFERTLVEVTREFEVVWLELFGAGRATLSTTPGEAGGPGGVELVVQPQGKRVIPMPLLSGGERALTALALVLALQQVSPSPFYVFDEVDAALDEANIINFADLLQKRAAKSQFLVVTHSLTTMARAATLYGVTQDGAGSSRILSVRLTADGHGVEAPEPLELQGVASRG